MLVTNQNVRNNNYTGKYSRSKILKKKFQDLQPLPFYKRLLTFPGDIDQWLPSGAWELPGHLAVLELIQCTDQSPRERQKLELQPDTPPSGSLCSWEILWGWKTIPNLKSSENPGISKAKVDFAIDLDAASLIWVQTAFLSILFRA